jgi:1-acyl-sn-glycerol-3-phosphate acyltransferase
MHWLYYAGREFTRVLLVLFTRWQVLGKENIPAKGPLLVVANHINLADPSIVGVCIGRNAAFLAKEELFRPRLAGYIMRRFSTFPVRRHGMNKESLRKAERFLAQGMALVIFPEGRRSQGARLESAYPGAALIAARSGAPVLPIGIYGTENIRGIAWLLRRPKVTVNIGAPFYPVSGKGKVSRAQLDELTHRILGRIAGLLPIKYRGNYAQQEVDSHES